MTFTMQRLFGRLDKRQRNLLEIGRRETGDRLSVDEERSAGLFDEVGGYQSLLLTAASSLSLSNWSICRV